MKFIRRARLLVMLAPLCLFAIPHPAPAQAPPAGTQMRLPPGAPAPTAEQNQRFMARNARFNQEYRAMLTDTKLTPAQKQAKAKQMAIDLNRDMLAILTPAQRAVVERQRGQVTQLRAAFLKKHQADIAQVTSLNKKFQASFTPAQRQKIKDIESQAREQAQKLQADTKTPAQAKQHTADAIMRNMRQQEMALLTAEQRSEMKQAQSIQAKIAQDLAAYAKAHGQQ